MPALSELNRPLPLVQRLQMDKPWEGVEEDHNRIYDQGIIEIGWQQPRSSLTSPYMRPNTVTIIGAMFGDEGKGRLIDNKIATMLEKKGIEMINVVRFQGGSNAGHTIETVEGKRISLHQIPSAILHEKSRGIIDQGVVVHVEDLQTEMEYAENIVGDLRGRVFLSRLAPLVTDLERAEEVLNRRKSRQAEGGTGRGIAATYAHHADRNGLQVADLLAENWHEKLGDRFDQYVAEFEAFDLRLADVEVPDFRKSKIDGERDEGRPVGSKLEFLDRLDSSRRWLISRNMTIDTTPLHRDIFHDPSQGILFEGAQGVGLNIWLGSYPDITASDTSARGISSGSAYYLPDNAQERIGVAKFPYTSSVGSRRLPTEIGLSKNHNLLPDNYTQFQERGIYIRETARERGTTTGRYRDVAEPDLANLSYNAVVGGIESLVATMMDISRPTDVIRVATHYRKNGDLAAYRPGMEYMDELKPVYINLPGWDGEAASRAKTFDDLPENAQKYLAFFQARTGFPIIAATTGPARDKFLTFNGYSI